MIVKLSEKNKVNSRLVSTKHYLKLFKVLHMLNDEGPFLINLE